jgi:hypothetical protein
LEQYNSNAPEYQQDSSTEDTTDIDDRSDPPATQERNACADDYFKEHPAEITRWNITGTTDTGTKFTRSSLRKEQAAQRRNLHPGKTVTNNKGEHWLDVSTALHEVVEHLTLGNVPFFTFTGLNQCHFDCFLLAELTGFSSVPGRLGSQLLYASLTQEMLRVILQVLPGKQAPNITIIKLLQNNVGHT